MINDFNIYVFIKMYIKFWIFFFFFFKKIFFYYYYIHILKKNKNEKIKN